MDRKKKDRENLIVTRFISNPSMYEHNLFSGLKSSETPDFSVNVYDREASNKQNVSIEITEVLNPELKQKESAQKRVVNLARDRFNKIRDDKLVVYVNFSNQPIDLKPEDITSLAEELCDFVLDICKRNETLEFRIKTTNKSTLNKCFHSITVKNDEEKGFENWQPFGAFRVPFIKESWFREKIDNKERKINNYYENFDQNWLVLVANFGHESSAFTFDSLKNSYQNSKFDKIYIYEYRPDKVIEL